jgi:NDP-sugar pyrophosphorylase family protein
MSFERAVILSAGKGSRLLPLTEDRPKCLLEFSGRTLLEWQLDALRAGGSPR